MVDKFGLSYETSMACLTKGMNEHSIGAGQLPWNRGSSRLTANKIRNNKRLMNSTGIIYLAGILDDKANCYLKIGIIKCTSKSHVQQYRQQTAIQQLNLVYQSV